MKKYIYLLFTFTLSTFSAHKAYAQPIANFEADKVSGCRPLVVSFKDLSTGAVSWEWDYVSGTSNVQNPSAFFSFPGTYDIRLIVTDADGAKDTLIKEDFISVYEFPTADFGQLETEICIGETIAFTDLSSANSGQLTAWTWDFGNGSTSTDQNPSISYQSAGVYPVSLLVSNEYGCTDNVIRSGLIKVNAPDVSFEGDVLLACGAPLSVNFTSLGDTLGSHEWFFGDGNSSAEVNPTHVFNSDGSFDVTHIVTDLEGCRDTLTKSNYIGIGVNTLTASVLDSSICVNDTAFFVSNVPSNSNIIWDFGNGQTDSVANPSVRYTSPGTYRVTALASDASGCSYNFEVEVEVAPYPNVSFGVADTTLGCSVPFHVDFVNTTVGGERFLWAFGDGNTSRDEHPSNTYTSVDSFTVALVAWGPTGCRAQTHPKDYIKIREVEAGFFAEPQQGCAPLDVVFQDTSHSPYPITTWEWDYGNGNTGTGYTSNVTYPNTGEYPVSLIVSNTRGCSDTLVIDEYIKSGTFPVMDFEIGVDTTCALTQVEFTNLTQGAQDFIWFFGDGDTAMSEHPKHEFLALGDLDITLVASDRGCADTLTKTAFVHVRAPLPVIGKNASRLCYLPDSVTLYNLSEEADYSYWTFPDGSTSTDPITSFTLYDDGQQNFFLTARNDSTGCIVTAEDSVVANNIKARFAIDQVEGCVPFTVSFSDSSINPVQWWWYFGNGDSSLIQNPTYTYYEPGDYTVTLRVRNSFYCVDTFIVQTVRALGPDANFQITSADAGCVPFDLSVQDLSTGTSPILSWEWDFGDGQISNQQNPIHTYQNPDLFSIGLTVTDADGCQDSLRKEDAAFITQPVPDFAVNPPANCTDVNSTFISLSSGSGLFYTWDFGDGNTSHLANTFHNYADTGLYDISLHVVDVNGCDSSITKPSFVEIQELKANFWADTLAAPCPPLTVNFKADNSFPHIGVKWKWDFGDGATSTDVFPTHIYNTPGSYDVSLYLESPEGCVDSMIFEKMVNIQGPISAFSFTPEDGCLGTTVDFQVDSILVDISYEWLFGDGNQSNILNVSHTYMDPGKYFPILIAKDTLGCEVFSTSPNPIDIYAPPTAAFTLDKTSLCDTGLVSFTSTSVSAGSSINKYVWYFGDGDSSLLQNPTHVYQSLGSYDVSLTVETLDGCRDTFILSNAVEVVPSPSISIDLNTKEGCIPFELNFSGDFKPYPGQINDWSWDLGDGNQFLGQQGSHTYEQAGEYFIQLDVSDVNGCIASALDTVYAREASNFDFSASNQEGCAPLSTDFTASSNANIVSWQWDFGDGNVSSLQNPTHTYTQNGSYTISLTATNEYGCSQTLQKEDFIEMSNPTAAFQLNSSAVCLGTELLFADESYGPQNISSWVWDFGDGNTSTVQNPLYSYNQSGSYDISLIITDIFGCSDTLLEANAVNILSDSLPDPIEIQEVSVRSDTEVDLQFERYNNQKKDFEAYLIYRMDAVGNYVLIDSIMDLSQNFYLNQGLNTLDNSYCYKVRVRNQCGVMSDLDLPSLHCSMNLQSQGMGEYISLSWNAYRGWPIMDGYRLYRVSSYDMNGAELLANLSSSDTVYVDSSMICDGAYSYRVEAVGPGGYLSLSDTSLSFTQSTALTQATDVINATVENDAFVSVEFNLADIEHAAEIIIERDAGSGFEEVSKQSLLGLNGTGKYQDDKADVQNKPYTYRAFSADSCGVKTPVGKTAKSIHTKASQASNIIKLSWNEFEGWENGVASYKVERFDDDSNSYIEIAEIPATLTSYEDHDPVGGNTLNCYRIVAIELDGNRKFSVSNSDCVGLDPMMFSATGFTPNGDGLNDVFKVTVSFVDTYELSIYNRWGKVVFQSNNPQQSWDGRTLSGQLAPEGVYFYSVSGRNNRGKIVQNNGSVSLLR